MSDSQPFLIKLLKHHRLPYTSLRSVAVYFGFALFNFVKPTRNSRALYDMVLSTCLGTVIPKKLAKITRRRASIKEISIINLSISIFQLQSQSRLK